MTTITADNPFPSLKPNGLNADWNCRGWRLMPHVQILDSEDGFFMIAIVVETHDGENEPLLKIYNANPELYEFVPENGRLFIQSFGNLPLERVYEIVNSAYSLEWRCDNEPDHDTYIEDVIVANAQACITYDEVIKSRGLHRFALDGSPDFIGEGNETWNGWGVPVFTDQVMSEFKTWVVDVYLAGLPDDDETHEWMTEYLAGAVQSDDGKWSLGYGACWYVDEADNEFPTI